MLTYSRTKVSYPISDPYCVALFKVAFVWNKTSQRRPSLLRIYLFMSLLPAF